MVTRPLRTKNMTLFISSGTKFELTHVGTVPGCQIKDRKLSLTKGSMIIWIGEEVDFQSAGSGIWVVLSS